MQPVCGRREIRGVPTGALILARWGIGLLLLLVVPVAHAGHPSTSRAVPKNGAVIVSKHPDTLEGRVVEVWRLSREVTIQTSKGTLEHVKIPREAAIQAPHGERGLSGIRRGMAVRVDGAGSQRPVAHKIVAHAEARAEAEGRPAGHRVAH